MKFYNDLVGIPERALCGIPLDLTPIKISVCRLLCIIFLIIMTVLITFFFLAGEKTKELK